MRTLILWRHAKSCWGDPGLPDFDRPLAIRGLRAAPKQADWIEGRFALDRVICSPALRARQTWQFLAARLPDAIPLSFDDRVYEAGWETLLVVLHETPPQTRHLLLVGHNPGLEDLTARLARPPGEKFATAACAVLEFYSDWQALAPGQARLVAFHRPPRR